VAPGVADAGANGEDASELHTNDRPWAPLMENPTWRVNTKRTLHDEVVAFCRLTAPTAAEIAGREEAAGRLREYVQSRWPQAKVEIYGSHVTGLSLFSSDIDTVVMDTNDPKVIYSLGDGLNFMDWVVDIQVIDKARVPIIKYVDAPTQIAVDVSFDEASGIENTAMMHRYVQQFPAMPPLVIVVKFFLKQRGLDETYTGGIGSYVLANLVVSFLQQHPRWAHFGQRPEEMLGVALVEFFQMFGTLVNYDQVGISVRNGGSFFPKIQKADLNWRDINKPDRLCLEDPHKPERDVGAPSFRWDAIRRAFGFAHRRLRAALRGGTQLSREKSALGLVIESEHLALRQDVVKLTDEVDLVRIGQSAGSSSRKKSAAKTKRWAHLTQANKKRRHSHGGERQSGKRN